MRTLVLLAVALPMALLGAGCADSDYAKEGNSAEQLSRDEALCRAQVRRMTAAQRNVDDSRRDVYRSDQSRTGQTALPDMISNQGDTVRTGRLMEQCMSARGYAPKASWWQKITS
jgi:hypothetical protein